MTQAAHDETLELAPIFDLYHRGQFLQAYRAAEKLGPLRDWRGPQRRVLAGRLTSHIGAHRLGTAILLVAVREHPDHTLVQYYHARALMQSRGILRTWEYVDPITRDGTPDSDNPAHHADWLSMRGNLAGHLRDFDTAEQCWNAAQALTPERPWIWVERADVLHIADRCDEAIEHALYAMSLREWYAPAVQTLAHFYEQANRDHDALGLMKEASEVIESCSLLAQLARLQIELEHYHDAIATLDRIAAMAPLHDKDWSQWLAASHSSTAYFCGQYEKAVEVGRTCKGEYFKAFADRLAALDDPATQSRRVVLPVPFVRQNHRTCAPATLASIGKFWSQPAEHLDVAEEICYDGTTAYSERKWAHDHEWFLREFRVTWESVEQLIDRGLPIILSTIHPASGHAQAIIGYDTVRRSFLIRDPGQRHIAEMLADEMLKYQTPHGPRGLVIVPPDRADLIRDLELPDSALYDLNYRVQDALQRHLRDDAARACEQLEATAPDHQITLRARLSLAAYDSDRQRQIAIMDRILELFPSDVNMELSRFASQFNQGARTDRLARLKAACERKDTDPLLWLTYARELAYDARSFHEARRMLRRVLRVRPDLGSALSQLATIHWEEQERQRALELFRLAYCLEDKSEAAANNYFAAARAMGQQDAAVAVLQARFKLFGSKSSMPARTLFDAYHAIGRTVDALFVLTKAINLRPDDGELMTFAAEQHARLGNLKRAGELLELARPCTPPLQWQRAMASVARLRGDIAAALEHWRHVLDIDPQSGEAHHRTAFLLYETQGRAAAIRHVQEAVDQFPHNFELCFLQVSLLRDEEPASLTGALDRLLKLDAENAWAQREMALVEARRGDYDAAVMRMGLAQRLAPGDPSCHHVLAHIYKLKGEPALARHALIEALRINVETEGAIIELVLLCETPDERREALAIIKQELVRQVLLADTMQVYRACALGVMSPDALLTDLREALDARPDLPGAWSAVIRQLLHVQQWDEALNVARRATERFPLNSQLLRDKSVVHRLRSDSKGVIRALTRAATIDPLNGEVQRELAEAFERAGDHNEALKRLKAAVDRAPLDATTRCHYAQLLWNDGKHDEALEHLKTALEHDPQFDEAWAVLADWAGRAGKLDDARAFARKLAQERGTSQAWIGLATLLLDGDCREGLEAIDHAIAMDPRSTTAHDLKAFMLMSAGRMDEALAACRPAGWSKPPPALRLREARIEAQRGRQEIAIGILEATLEDEPSFFDGWRALAQWYHVQERKEDFERVAHEMLRIAPNSTIAMLYLAEAQKLFNRTREAEAYYRRVLELEPDNTGAGVALAHQLIDERAYANATKVLNDLRRRCPDDPGVLAALVRLHVTVERESDAMTAFRALCLNDTDDGGALADAYKLVRESPWEGKLPDVLSEAIMQPKVNPDLGSYWLWDSARRMDSLRNAAHQLEVCFRHKIAGDRAAAAFVRIAKSAQETRDLNRIIRKFRDRFQQSTEVWSEVTAAYYELRSYGEVGEWTHGWDQRADAQPWVLLCLMLSLRMLHRQDEAYAVCWRALQLPPDRTTELLRVWAAFHLAARGRAEEAAAQLQFIDYNSLDDEYRCLFSLAKAAGAVRVAAAQGRSTGFKEARKMLADTVRRYAGQFLNPLYKTARRETVQRIAADAGGLFAWLWKRTKN